MVSALSPDHDRCAHVIERLWSMCVRPPPIRARHAGASRSRRATLPGDTRSHASGSAPRCRPATAIPSPSQARTASRERARARHRRRAFERRRARLRSIDPQRPGRFDQDRAPRPHRRHRRTPRGHAAQQRRPIPAQRLVGDEPRAPLGAGTSASEQRRQRVEAAGRARCSAPRRRRRRRCAPRTCCRSGGCGAPFSQTSATVARPSNRSLRGRTRIVGAVKRQRYHQSSASRSRR